MSKIIAFYLPQFHTIPENDQWWGTGFTEWVNVKKASPLTRKHRQPRVPMDNNYYNLEDKSVMTWQFELAESHGIYGFCYYHYWFNGKLLLNKPLENMINIETRIPYCFCWANQEWTRSWDSGKEKEVIMPQQYGGEKEWEDHFLYLLNFFKDEKYIKIDDKPVFIIYCANDIPRCDEMISYFDKRCIDENLNGIYVIEERNSYQEYKICNNSKAILDFEPMFTIQYQRSFVEKALEKLWSFSFNLFHKTNITLHSYDMIWNRIIHRKYSNNQINYPGAYIDWDNTARRGKKAKIVNGANVKKFEIYFKKLYEKAKKGNSEFIFVNAWNEWAEGTYLEPDKNSQLGYLKAIKKITDSSVYAEGN